jgi:hypothetical protein
MRLFLSMLLLALTCLPAHAAGKGERAVPQPDFVRIITSWSSETDATELKALPSWRPELRAGYITDEESLAAFWQVFKPGTIPPRVDFQRNLFVFVAREALYRQLVVMKVALKDGVAEVVANGNKTDEAPPDRLSVAAVVIPRAGIDHLKVGKQQAPIW